MPSDLISLIVIFFSSILIFINKFNLKFKFSFTFKLLFLYILVGIFSSIFSPFDISFFDILKEPYLFLTSVSVTILLGLNKHKPEIISLSIHLSFITILFFSILGYLLFYFGIDNTFISSSKIINVALPIFQNLPLPPRAVSIIKPTSNLLAIYLTLYFPIFLINYQLKIQNHFKRNNFLKKSYFFAIYSTPIISLLTYSRAFLPLLLLLFFIPNPFPITKKYFYKYSLIISAIIFSLLLIFIQFFTVFYTTNSKLSLNSNYGDSIEKKEIVNLGQGKKLRPNPVYFDDEKEGKKTLTFTTDIHLNHYFWLKKSALLTQHESNYTKIFGFGSSSFNKYIQSEFSTLDNNIKDGLKGYIGSQSQFFTTLITHGKVGILILFFLISNALIKLIYKKVNTNEINFNRLKIYMFFSIILISLDCDISTIRFIWALLPHVVFIEKLYESKI